jgi:D-glycero-alpha-D-manno-heptose-7-phosphate kinase
MAGLLRVLNDARSGSNGPDLIEAMETIDLGTLLERDRLTASVPCRIDCGGTLDLSALALQLERFSPSTVTIAISPRTTATLSRGPRNKVIVQSSTIGSEKSRLESLPLKGPFSLVNAIVQHFGVTGLRLTIRSDVPMGSGLGGSGSVAVAVVAVISAALAKDRNMRLPSRFWIAWMARELENSVQASLTGFQDQLAAVYGGVNCWTWHYARHRHPYTRNILMETRRLNRLNLRIAVAFTGEERVSTSVSERYSADYLAGKTRREWIRIVQLVTEFSDALVAEEWRRAATTLREEMNIREQICSDLWPNSALSLRAAAQYHGCVVRTTGGNKAGSVWAFGEPDAILRVQHDWGTATLNAEVARSGLILTSGKAASAIL